MEKNEIQCEHEMGGKSIREVKSAPVCAPESNKKTTILIITKKKFRHPFSSRNEKRSRTN